MCEMGNVLEIQFPVSTFNFGDAVSSKRELFEFSTGVQTLDLCYLIPLKTCPLKSIALQNLLETSCQQLWINPNIQNNPALLAVSLQFVYNI